MDIGIALSGGGYRATVFHLGVLARLAEDNLLEELRFISTVSGGSIAAGLVFAANENQWPPSREYQTKVVPYAFKKLTTQNLQLGVILDSILAPLYLLSSRAKLVSRRLAGFLGMEGSLQELPASPRWLINATCFETGRNWRFEKQRMGGYLFGYVDNPDYPISDAVAASSGFPVFIGPLTVTAKNFAGWYTYDILTNRRVDLSVLPADKVHLYDGGVYDNLGLEPLVNYSGPKNGYSLRKGIDYLFVSNASGKLDPLQYSPGFTAVSRLVSIPKYQIEALRSRDVLHRIVDHKLPARYFDTDNTCRKVLTDAGFNDRDVDNLCLRYLEKSVVERLARVSTKVSKLKANEFRLLFRLGYEVADCTLHAYEAKKYALIGFDTDQWDRLLSAD